MTQWKRLSKMGISKVSQRAQKRMSFLTLVAFVKLLQCASKFGDDLNISANKDLVSLNACLVILMGSGSCP